MAGKGKNPFAGGGSGKPPMKGGKKGGGKC